MDKPPLGVMPEWLYEEKYGRLRLGTIPTMDISRINNLLSAINRRPPDDMTKVWQEELQRRMNVLM